MPFLALSGPGATAGFRFDATAAISFLVSSAVVISFRRDCFGRSRAAVAAAALLVAVNVLLGCAVAPVAFIALWQFQWFLTWGLSLFFAEEDVRAWLGRLVITGWLFDSVLIAAALTPMPAPVAELPSAFLSLAAWGGALALANRLAAVPVGAHALWNDQPLRPAVAWMLVSSLPSATILILRLIELLSVEPTSYLHASQFLVVVALAAAMASLRQESVIRETAWRFSAALAGFAAVALMMPSQTGRIVWITAVAGCVLAGRRLTDSPLPRPQLAAPESLLGQLELAAAREWNLPRVWRFGIEMPLRGASQILRFADGFLFEQLPAQAFRRMEASLEPLRRVLPELFSRLLLTLLLASAFLVLLTLAFR